MVRVIETEPMSRSKEGAREWKRARAKRKWDYPVVKVTTEMMAMVSSRPVGEMLSASQCKCRCRSDAVALEWTERATNGAVAHRSPSRSGSGCQRSPILSHLIDWPTDRLTDWLTSSRSHTRTRSLLNCPTSLNLQHRRRITSIDFCAFSFDVFISSVHFYHH